MIVELKSKSGLIKIDSKGAELISFQDVFGTEYIWQKDEKYWGRSSPILFPIVGNLRENKVKIEGKEYNIPKHGFCRDAEFKVLFKNETKAIFSYSDNEKTREIYPYKFNLTLTYAFEDGKLEISYCVLNQDEKPIDFCLGAHPAFNFPLKNDGEFDDYFIQFNKSEPDGCPIYDLEKLQINVENRVNLLDEKNRLY
ncbi:MAG: aldose 1-epimerase family protein, partial [Oscillospiraceae bacterium]